MKIIYLYFHWIELKNQNADCTLVKLNTCVVYDKKMNRIVIMFGDARLFDALVNIVPCSSFRPPAEQQWMGRLVTRTDDRILQLRIFLEAVFSTCTKFQEIRPSHVLA